MKTSELEMTIAKALKEKNRLVGKISTLKRQIEEENSIEDTGTERSIDIKKAVENLVRLQNNLIALKAAIARANVPVAATIAELSETKSMISWLNSLCTREGNYRENAYGNTVTRSFSAVITKQNVKKTVEIHEKSVEELQDKLDEFNAKTKLKVLFLEADEE